MDAQYTAITGSGYNGSENYCVAYPNYYQSDVFPETGSATETVKGVYVTNNVWAYQAIINGDSYASAFGGANGDEPDYFRIRAIGYNENNEASDTTYFYLADYRFENNTQDYVVTDWQYFDLSVLGAVSKIRFSVEGSKTNENGLVTPAYFCMDNFNGDAPDQAPIVTNTTSVHLLESDNEATVNLLDLVTDPDNEDSEIVFSIESGDNTDVADFNITDSTLTVTRTEGNHGNTTLNIQATSNGLSVNFEIPVTVDEDIDLAPVVTNTTSVHLLESDNEATVNLLDLVTDPDNEDSEIVFSIESGDNTDIADFNITDSTLTVTRTDDNHGSTTLNIQATSNGLSVNFEIPVTVDVITGIENIESMNVSCYPNPCSDYIYVNKAENASYKIISVNGAIVSEGKILSNDNFRINTRNIKQGVYQLMIVTPTSVKTLKLIRE